MIIKEESKNKGLELQLRIRENSITVELFYGSEGPETYAQMLIRINVRQAPANPVTIYLVLNKIGITAWSHGKTCVAVKSATIPATNPKRATNAKTFNLSPKFYTLAYIRILSPFLV